MRQNRRVLRAKKKIWALRRTDPTGGEALAENIIRRGDAAR